MSDPLAGMSGSLEGMGGPLAGEALGARLTALGAEVVTAPDGLRVATDVAGATVLMRRLREDPELAMDRLVDLTAIDHEREPLRFELVYRLARTDGTARLRVHVALDPTGPLPESVVALWPGADWPEREVFDLFGLSFRSHPGLRRLLLEAGFEGAPLRREGGSTTPRAAAASSGDAR